MTIAPKPVTPDNFAPYGEIAQRPAGEPTASEAAFSYWSDVASYRIDGPTEIGYCTAFRQPEGSVPWVERHARTPELIIPIDAPVLLPVTQEVDADPEAFRIEPGEAVVMGKNTWHGACHPAEGEEATYFVVFRRGTPQEDVVMQELQNVILSANA